MKKKFKKIEAIATEVSLCNKNNSGANKKTTFEIVKSEDNKTFTNEDFKEFVKFGMEELASIEPKSASNDFAYYIQHQLDNSVNIAIYNLLSDGLMSALCDIKYMDISKESRILLYKDLFQEFINQYKNSPITKNKDGEFMLSITKDTSLSKDVVNPQTVEEIGDDMEEKQVGIIKSVMESLKSLISPTQKSEEPAEEPKEEAVVEEPKAEEPKEEAVVEEPKAEEPVEEAKDEDPAKEEPAEEVEKEDVEAKEPVEEQAEIEKASIVKTELEKAQAKIEELEKAQAKNLEIIEKSKYVEKAKSEFSMLSGTAEEVGEKLYSIAKSNLPVEIQEFILANLKRVSSVNEELTKSVGTESTDIELSDEELEVRDIYKKAEEIAKAKNISINKALREV